MKKFLGAALVVICLVCWMAAGRAELYPLCGIVSAIDTAENTVSIRDFTGNIWMFYGVEDWAIGDIVAMIMDDMNTGIIYDDEIIMIHYNGWLSPP